MDDDNIVANQASSFDDEETMEFVITETDEQGRETTWEWDGNRWTRLA